MQLAENSTNKIIYLEYAKMIIIIIVCRASNQSRLSGYVDWSLANFTVDKLLDGEAFPAFSAHELQVYDRDGEVIEVESSVFSSNFAVFVPFVDWDCLVNVNVSALINLTAEERVNLVNATINLEDALMDFNGTNAVPGLGGPDAGDPSKVCCSLHARFPPSQSLIFFLTHSSFSCGSSLFLPPPPPLFPFQLLKILPSLLYHTFLPLLTLLLYCVT